MEGCQSFQSCKGLLMSNFDDGPNIEKHPIHFKICGWCRDDGKQPEEHENLYLISSFRRHSASGTVLSTLINFCSIMPLLRLHERQVDMLGLLPSYPDLCTDPRRKVSLQSILMECGYPVVAALGASQMSQAWTPKPLPSYPVPSEELHHDMSISSRPMGIPEPSAVAALGVSEVSAPRPSSCGAGSRGEST